MPLFEDDSVQENLHQTAEKLETTVITASDVSQTAITNNISGYKWEVDFYNQILGNGDLPKQPDVGLNITLQSYRKIDKLEMILTSPLNTNDPLNLVGEAYVNIGSAVHKNDIFIGTLRNNKTAIFIVEENVNETYEDNNIFKINFKLFGYSTDETLYESIINKVATNYVYNSDYKFSNNSPVILKKNALSFEYGMNQIKSIMNIYFNKYFDNRLRCINIRDTEGTMIDPFLNDFITKVFSSQDYPMLMTINRIEGDRSNYLTLFDCLISAINTKTCNKLYSSSPLAYYSTVYFKTVMNVEFMASVSSEDYKPYFDNEYYFVTDKFYTEEESDVEVENLIKTFINKKTVNAEDISKHIDAIKFDNPRIDYYIVPILCFIYSVYLWNNK